MDSVIRRISLLVLALVGLSVTSGCSSPPEVVLKIQSDPAGAQVFLSRRGEKAVEGSFAVVKGDMKSEALVEDFIRLGTTPLEYSSPLAERESGASAFGVGVKVMRRYDTGLLRLEKEGYEPDERLVRFKDGEVDVNFSLRSEGGRRAGLSQTTP